MTYVTPIMDHINITTCLYNGMDVVAPRHGVDIVKQNISGNLGYAVNIFGPEWGLHRISTVSIYTPCD